MKAYIHTAFNGFTNCDDGADFSDLSLVDQDALITAYIRTLTAVECFELMEMCSDYDDLLEFYKTYIITGSPLTMEVIRLKIRQLDSVRDEIQKLIDVEWADAKVAA